MVTSEEVKHAEIAAKTAKLELGIAKADALLFTNWEEKIGKAKPTVGEKDAYCLKCTEDLGIKYIIASAEHHHLQRVYDEEQAAKEEI